MPNSANTADEYDFVDHQDTALSPETYRKWHDSPDHGSLWIKGVPGAGKSVMAASMIQHLRTTENCLVLFFFFRNIVAANFSPRALIQDWLAQLLPHSPKLQSRLQDSLHDTSDNELIQLFLDGVSCVPKLYCVGDALDEMSTDSTPILERLNGLATHRPRTLKLLMTSRPSRTLQSTLRDSSIVHISLQQRLVDVDIHSYLNHRFDNAPTLEHHRLFLYAKLTMDQVEDSLRSDAALNRYDKRSGVTPGGTALHVLAEGNQHWQLEGLSWGLVHQNRDVKGLARPEAVKILLDHGAYINALDNDKLTPLQKASNAPDVTKKLLSRGADATIGKESPLFEAIFDQNQEVLEALLNHGSSPDILSEAKHSWNVHYNLTKSRRIYPVLCAVFAEKLNTQVANSIPLLRTLIGHGANLYLPLNDDETLIHFLFVYPNYEVIDELLKPPCASQIDFNHRNQQGQTVLMAACNWRETLPGFSHRHWEKLPRGPPVRILDLGAGATLVDNLGKTALYHLLSNPGLPDDTLIEFINRTEVASTLFQADEEGYLPLHYALRLLRPRVCEALLMKGADLLQPDPEGRTALHYIASQCLLNTREPGSPGRLNIELGDDYFNQCHVLWKKFIVQGGSINFPDKAGNTPLHTYLSSPPSNGYDCHPESCHTDHFTILFPEDSGVDIFALNKSGEGALHMIAGRVNMYNTVQGHDKKLFLLMMNKGLDPLKEDQKGRSALDIANACEKDDIVGLLGRKRGK
ncbi:Ankyrin-3 [Fusarium agapanthi]|uniref:Ankyrin-3 n=1 Tax=Fusarium agapanthi TaxID=1803897 RepID=A0A9P5BKH5_9HYPO|nr:Ankyrin-3 [Fusarium agapanthi]